MPSKNAAKRYPAEVGGACGSLFSFRFQGSAGFTQNHGGLFGLQLNKMGGAPKSEPHNASKYAGIGFWAKTGGERVILKLRLSDAYTHPDGGVCRTKQQTTDKTMQCDDDNAKIVPVEGSDWTFYTVWFDEMEQGGWGYQGPGALAGSDLFAVKFNVRSDVNPNGWDLFVDGIQFID